MKRTHLTTAAVALAISLNPIPGTAQTHPSLHISNRWKECSIQLDPSLTQAAWRQFTQEAGLVAYFRPLSDAKPMGKGNFEVSLLQWETAIDDHDAAWNDTFVHPDSAHWLFEGDGLKFPGLMARMGVARKTDVGLYLTKNFNANYGFAGVQVQQNLVGSSTSKWAAAARLSATTLYGPRDVNLAVAGLDLVGSREIAIRRWASVSPYIGVSTYASAAHEKSSLVNLEDESQTGSQAMVGATVQVSAARFAIEYNVSKVNSLSMKVGFGR
jgi:hypothetical protein